MYVKAGRQTYGEALSTVSATENWRRWAVALVALVLTCLWWGDEAASAALPPVLVSQVKDIEPGPDDGLPFYSSNGNEEVGGLDLNGRLILTPTVPKGSSPGNPMAPGPAPV